MTEPTQAEKMVMLSLPKLGLVPNSAMIASPMRQTMIQVATTTAGPWFSAVMRPCGG